VTLTFLTVNPAVSEISNVVVMVVEFTTVAVPTVTPEPDTVTVVPVAVKLLPVSVTGTFVPRRPLPGHFTGQRQVLSAAPPRAHPVQQEPLPRLSGWLGTASGPASGSKSVRVAHHLLPMS